MPVEVFTVEYDDFSRFANFISGQDHDTNAVPTLVAGSFNHITTSKDETVQLSFQTIAKADSSADAAKMVARVEAVLNQVNTFQQDITSENSVWLRKAASAQTDNRQLIVSWTRQDNEFMKGGTLVDNQSSLMSTWTLECQPLSEHVIANHVTKTASAINFEGGTYDATAVNAGTANGRIKVMKVTANDDINKMYIGIKRGSHTGFDPIMYAAGAGFENISGSSTGASAESSSGNIVTSSLTSEAMAQRFKVAIDTGQDDDLAGTYLVLWRGRYEGAADDEVRLRCSITFDLYGIVTMPLDSGHDIFIGGGTNMVYREMGIFTFPPDGYRKERRDNSGTLSTLGLVLWAERVSGTLDLRTDSFTLIPWEHHASIDDPRHDNGNSTYLINSEDNIMASYSVDPSPYRVTQGQFSTNNWVYPTNEKTFWVVAAQDGNGNVTGDITVEIKVVPRDYGSNLN